MTYRETILRQLLDSSDAAVSFDYGKEKIKSQFSAPVLHGITEDHKEYLRVAYTDDRKVKAELTIRIWEDQAAEWVMTFSNVSDGDSDAITEILYCDFDLPYSAGRTLYPRIAWSKGSAATDDDFMYYDRRISRSQRPSEWFFGSDTGRSSDDDCMPYVNIMASKTQGAIFASGWSGNWKGHFFKTKKAEESIVSCRLIFPNADFILHAGESVTLPSVLMLPWECEDNDSEASGAYNCFRRFIHRHMFPKINGKPAVAPICLRGWGGFDMPLHEKRMENVKKHQLKADLYGIDAAWYSDEVSKSWYPDAGDWEASSVHYPNCLEELAELCHSVGLDFSVWMEYERVGVNSKRIKDEGAPLLRRRDPGAGDGSALIDLGSEEGYNHIFGKICELIDKTGIKVFRIDFNIKPADFWAENDEENRHGITELRYINGMYRLYDSLLAKYPGLIIDNCASGGRRLDYAIGKRAFPIMCRSDYFCSSDFGENGMQNMTLCLSKWLPVFSDSLGSCLQSGRTNNVGDTYRFRSTVSSGICIACPDFELTAEEAAWYQRMLADAYRIRPYMCRDIYPITGASVSEKDMCAYQAHDPESDSGLVAVFRRSECAISRIEFGLRGIDENAVYILDDIDEGLMGESSGKELTKLYGVDMPQPCTARYIFYRKK